jgi:hypothetical protein
LALAGWLVFSCFFRSKHASSRGKGKKRGRAKLHSLRLALLSPFSFQFPCSGSECKEQIKGMKGEN